MVGFPGTISALHQQAGRAGRVREESLAVLLITPDPLDQFLAANPQYILEKPIENALINPDNLLILVEHMKCAAFELPFQLGDRFGSVTQNMVADIMDYLLEINLVHQTEDRFFWMSNIYPSGSVSLRTTSADIVFLHLDNSDLTFDKKPKMIGHVEKRSSLWMVHPDAVYLHEGKSFHVKELDLETNIAWMRPLETDYYTTPKIQSEVDVENIYQKHTSSLAKHYTGEVLVREQVVGFRRIQWYTNEVLEARELDLPATDLHTTAYWICFTEKLISSLKDSGSWSSGRIDYGADWKRQRLLARQRDGFRCQFCGEPEKDRSHDVHHKIPFKKFSSPDQANHLENLITLCPICHRKAETSVRIRTGLTGVGYALGNLAPLHLMCDRADLGIHTDPESKIAGSLPVVMIYEHIPAGIGLSQRLFETHEALIDHAVNLVSDCRCKNGCPSCIGPGTDEEIGGKVEALTILKLLTEHSLSSHEE
jgi:DEAD/DEAH box helicase domain-containing protein